MDTRARIEANRTLWNRWAGMHVPSAFYDADGFVADLAERPFDRIVAALVGDLTGQRALHLQCHFGMDTLRLALLGAQATGVDFSAEAIAAARELSDRAGIPATFVESDVTDLPADVPEGAFDLIFTSYGAISWLPDLEPWAKMIASRLAPGGLFKVADMHPFLWVFDEEAGDFGLTAHYSYFQTDALEWQEFGSYAAPSDEYVGTSHSWQHTFEEIVGVLVGAGLVIEQIREFPLLAWQHSPSMVEREPGLYGQADGAVPLPLMFTLTARKPGA